jgi:hypothetical protein
MPGVGLDFDVLLLGGSSMSMSMGSYTYNAYINENNNDASFGNDDVDSAGKPTTTTTTTTELVDEATGEIVVISSQNHLEQGHSSATIINAPSTSNTQAPPSPTATIIHETFASIPTSPAATSATTRSLLPLISIAGGLVAIGAIIGGVYRSKKQKTISNNNGRGGIVHLDEKSIQSINSKSTDESEMSASMVDEENNSSLESMAAMSTLVTSSSSSSWVDRRASI